MKRVIVAAFLMLMATAAFGEVSANVVERVKRFRHGTNLGSAFTIEVGSRQYLLTARHLLNREEKTIQFDLFLGGEWKSFSARAIYPSNKTVDIVALDLDTAVTVDLPLEPTAGGIRIGQQVYFVGYPLGLATRGGLPNSATELPFVKSGVMSAMDSRQKDAMILYVDGHNNPGFSGGPVVFQPSGSQDFRVAGIITSYTFEGIPVVRRSDLKNLKAKAYKDLYIRANTGILIAYNIKHIVEAIEREAQAKGPKN